MTEAEMRFDLDMSFKTLPTPDFSRRRLSSELMYATRGLPIIDRLKASCRPWVSPVRGILAMIPLGARLFDVGCGVGSLLFLAQTHRRTSSSGYEVSLKTVENSRLVDWGDMERPDITLQERGIPPVIKEVDVVTMLDVLHHVSHSRQDEFLQTLVSNLPSGSRFILADVDAGHLPGRLANQMHDLIVSREWVHPRRPEEIVNVLSVAGLEISDVFSSSALWYRHFVIVGTKRPVTTVKPAC